MGARAGSGGGVSVGSGGAERTSPGVDTGNGPSEGLSAGVSAGEATGGELGWAGLLSSGLRFPAISRSLVVGPFLPRRVHDFPFER
jgi:hypothetical protein